MFAERNLLTFVGVGLAVVAAFFIYLVISSAAGSVQSSLDCLGSSAAECRPSSSVDAPEDDSGLGGTLSRRTQVLDD